MIRYFLLVVFCLALTSRASANKIDDLKTDADAIAFIRSLLKKRDIEINLRYDKNTNEAEAKTRIESWGKADLNADGLTDMVFNINIGTYGVIAQKNNKFNVFNLTYTLFPDLSRFESAKIIQHDQLQLVAFYSRKARVLPRSTPVSFHEDSLTVDTLTYKLNSFIEYNPAPQKKEIAGIAFRTEMCFGECPIFSIDIDAKGRATYIGGEFNQDQGTFKGSLIAATLQPFYDVINYIDLKKTRDDYAVNWTDDATCYLTIKFKDGTVKQIKDYGEQGTFGLKKLYAMFFKLRKDQLWYRQ